MIFLFLFISQQRLFLQQQVSIMPQFRVTVPPGVKGGQVVKLTNLSSNTTKGRTIDDVQVTIPLGLQPGDSFTVQIDDSDKKTQRRKNSKRNLLRSQSTSRMGQSSSGWSDLAMALSIGLLIGLSMLTGFLWGVLSVTEPLHSPHTFLSARQQQQVVSQTVPS